jgi:Ubiquitin carboxyl-terminal hydrolase
MLLACTLHPANDTKTVAKCRLQSLHLGCLLSSDGVSSEGTCLSSMPKPKEGSLTFHALHLKNLITGEVKSYRDVPVAFDRRNIYVQHPDFKYQIKVGKAGGVDSTSVLFTLAVRGYDDREFHFVDPSDKNQYAHFVRCAQTCFDRAARDAQEDARGDPPSSRGASSGSILDRRPAFAQRRQPRKFGTAGLSRSATVAATAERSYAGDVRSRPAGLLKKVAPSTQPNRYKQETFSDDDDDPLEEDAKHEAREKPKSARVTSDPAEHTDSDRIEEMEAEEEAGRPEEDDEEPHEQEKAGIKPNRAEDRVPARAKRIGRRLVKANKSDDHDDSSDDDDFLRRPASLTTPAVQRVVSPSTLKATKDHNGEEEEDDTIDKNQRTITSFFQARAEGDPNAARQPKPTDQKASASTPSPATTPSRLSASAVRIVKSSNSKIQNETFLRTSPMRTPSLDVRRQRMFGRGSRSTAIPRNPMDVLDRADEAAGSFGPTAVGVPPVHFPRTVKRPRLNPQNRLRPHDLEDSNRRVPFSPLPEGTQDEVVEDRPVSRFRGIRNLGNTCYCASTLQMLCSAFRFIESIQGRGGRLTRSLAHLSKSLQLELPSNAPVDPREVKDAMDAITDRFAGYEQRDAHEFVGELVDRIHDELEEEQQKSVPADDHRKSERLPTDDFRMTIHKVLKCESCGYER